MILLAAGALVADLSQLRPVTDEAYRAEAFAAPYVSVFERGGKSLIFVAGDHGSGADTPVARTIREAFRAHRPRAVVVEGISPDEIEGFAEFAGRRMDEEPARLSEARLAAGLARRAGLPVATGELRDREEFAFVRAAGFTIEDYVFYYAAASMPSWRANGLMKEPGFREKAAGHMNANARAVGVPRRFHYEDFERWYRSKVRLDKAPEDLSYGDSGPLPGPERNYLQRIALVRDRPREEAIVRVIVRLLERHDRVLVVYGSGHLVKQRRVWQALLGPSKDSKPF